MNLLIPCNKLMHSCEQGTEVIITSSEADLIAIFVGLHGGMMFEKHGYLSYYVPSEAPANITICELIRALFMRVLHKSHKMLCFFLSSLFIR